jgi:hypothetical protein
MRQVVRALDVAGEYLGKAVADGLMAGCARPPKYGLAQVENALASLQATKASDMKSATTRTTAEEERAHILGMIKEAIDVAQRELSFIRDDDGEYQYMRGFVDGLKDARNYALPL